MKKGACRLVLCFAFPLLLACGETSATAPPAAVPVTGANADTPAGRCLAVAGAKRERKPTEPKTIKARHLLVKYAGAKRAPAVVTRSREKACLRAEEARAELASGKSFSNVVDDYSEEPGASTREGSLGAIERSQVVPPFADAAFELAPGEVSHVVETDFGFHVIMRTE